MNAGKRRVDMVKVRAGLAKEPPPYVTVDEGHRLRVLVVGGDTSTRSVVAALVTCAMAPFVGSKMINSAFLDTVEGQAAIDALAGYTVSIRDGGS